MLNYPNINNLDRREARLEVGRSKPRSKHHSILSFLINRLYQVHKLV